MTREIAIANKKMLDLAIKKLGWRVVHSGKLTYIYTPDLGVMTVSEDGKKITARQGMEETINTLQSAYAEAILTTAGMKSNWNVKEEKKNVYRFSGGGGGSMGGGGGLKGGKM